jgi:PAS domain S-box-containing protein
MPVKLWDDPSARKAMPTDVITLQQAQLLIERVADYAIYMLTPDGHVASWNAGARRFKGYMPAEIIGQHFSRFYTPEDQAIDKPAMALQRARDTGSFEDEGWRVRKDGSRFWASVVIDPIHDDAGVLVGFAKITRDISEKRAAHEAQRRSEEHFRLLVQGVTDYAIYMLSPEGAVTSWNAGAAKIKGYTEAEILGTHFSRFYTEADRRAGLPQQALDMARSASRYAAEGYRVRKDGSTFWASVVIDPIADSSGKLLGFAKVTRDISERFEIEQARVALQNAQKLESLGKLTGGVAHDFNNILQIIGGCLQLLNTVAAGNNAAQRHLSMALGAVDRGAKLSSQLLAFARRQPLQPLVLNVGRVVRANEELLRRALGETVELEMVVSASLWNTRLDPSQLENVVLNLAINARDAMPRGGRLTIELGNTLIDDTYKNTDHDVPRGQYVLVAVTDTGTGMSKAVLEKAVEPFFTTKSEGKGTGLGLSMAFGFVKQSGGHFRIYSEPEHGTTIKMYFPRTQESEQVLPEAVSAEVTGGTETILVVEDDPNVQATVVALLGELGYAVLKADDADSALTVLKSGVRCDLLFTDVVMPGKLKSTELARQAKALLPDLRVLYTSGYTQNSIIHGGRLDPGVELLSKPYRREQLASKLRQLLAPASEADNTSVPVQPAVPVPSGGRLQILLVDDDAQGRELCRDMLTASGHVTVEATSAGQALLLMAQQRFDAAVIDFHLPDMNGLVLGRRLVQLQEGLPVIYAAGHGALDVGEPGAAGNVLLKPFTDVQLQRALRRVMVVWHAPQ